MSTDAKAAAAKPDDQQRFIVNNIDMRDDRVSIAGAMPGTWIAHVSYLVRAVTPGEYVQPPVRAEQMYDINENSIRGAGGKFIVTSATADVATVHE